MAHSITPFQSLHRNPRQLLAVGATLMALAACSDPARPASADSASPAPATATASPHGTRAKEQPAMAAPTSYNIPRLAQVTVDGKASDWSANALHVTAFSDDLTLPVDANRFQGEARIGWTDQGLAVLVTMQSDAPWSEESDTNKLYAGDSIELFLRQGDAWKMLVQTVISPGLDTRFAEARQSLWDYRGSRADWADTPLVCDMARTQTDHGAVIECLIPWSQLRIQPSVGLEVQFRINLNKVIPGSGRRQWVWRNADGGEFQRLVLADASAVATQVTQAAWSVGDGADRVAFRALAPAADQGTAFTVTRAGAVVGSTSLIADGDRSLATLWLPTALVSGSEALTLTIGKNIISTVSIADPLPNMRRELERAWRGGWGRSELAEKISPQVPALLAPGKLPDAHIGDLDLLRRLGVNQVETTWYNAEHQHVTTADAGGRYGAVISATLSSGETMNVYRTAVLLGDGLLANGIAALLGEEGTNEPKRLREALSEDRSVAALYAAALEAKKDGKPLNVRLRSNQWWHAQRTALGLQTVYPYASSKPPGYADNLERRWPAVIYLHGSGGGLPSDYGDMAKRLEAAGERDLLGWAKGKHPPFALYALQATGGWEPEAVLDVVNKILAEDRIDPDRLVVMGFSMGGMGTWSCVADHPERWAAAVPIGGRGSYADEVANFTKLPIWVFNGDVDRTTTLADAQKIVDALTAAGGNVRLTVIPDAGHGESQNGTYNTPGLWEWLAEQKRR